MTNEQIEELKTLISSKTHKELAEHFGVSPDKIRWLVRKHNLKSKPKYKRSLTEIRWIALHSRRHGVASAAEKFGISEDIVKNCSKRVRAHVKKWSTDLGSEAILKFRGIAVKYAIKRKMADQAEDFGSFAVVEMLHRGESNLKWLLSNFVGLDQGNCQTEKGRMQRNAQTVELDDPDSIQVADKPTFSEQEAFDGFFKASGLHESVRSIFMLAYLWGMNGTEIAFIFNQPYENTLMILSKIKNYLARNIEKVIESR